MKQRSFFSFSSGFTLIELLVVISIIGVLSTIVLSQLGEARSKAKDAHIKSQMKNMTSAGLLIYEIQGESYLGICNYETSAIRFRSMKEAIPNAACSSGTGYYRVYAPMSQTNQCTPSSGTDYLCTDANGNIVMLASPPPNGQQTCPASCI